MTSGEKIKKYRLEKGFTQEELANEAGISKISIQQYEGNRRNAKFETILKIAKALGISASLIFPDREKHINFLEALDLLNITPAEWHEMTEDQRRLFEFDVKNFDIITNFYTTLNHEGRKKAAEQIELLTKIPEYKLDK